MKELELFWVVGPEVLGKAGFGVGAGTRGGKHGSLDELFSQGRAGKMQSICCLEVHREGQVAGEEGRQESGKVGTGAPQTLMDT